MLAKLKKRGNKWVCSNCGEEVREWVECVSGVAIRWTFNKKGKLEEVEKDYYGEVVEIQCGNCGAEFNENPGDVFEKVRENCIH
jgi:DNA-directed RNA polymerase subunit RPC12/RpoP